MNVFKAKELPTYKDNDFINDGQKIYIGEENKKIFLEKLRKDVEVNAFRFYVTPFTARTLKADMNSSRTTFPDRLDSFESLPV